MLALNMPALRELAKYVRRSDAVAKPVSRRTLSQGYGTSQLCWGSEACEIKQSAPVAARGQIQPFDLPHMGHNRREVIGPSLVAAASNTTSAGVGRGEPGACVT